MISICCPSRNRPEFAARLCKSVARTAVGEVEILFHIDNDDPTFSEYQKLCPEARLVRGDRHVLGTLYNRLWKESSCQVLMMTGDDIHFASVGWDAKIIKVLNLYADKICFIAGNKSPHFIGPTYLFVSRRVCDILGYFSPPWLNRWIDIWAWEIANGVGRALHVDMDMEYFHPVIGTREADQVMVELNKTLDHDRKMFDSSSHVRAFDAEILRQRIANEKLVLM